MCSSPREHCPVVTETSSQNYLRSIPEWPLTRACLRKVFVYTHTKAPCRAWPLTMPQCSQNADTNSGMLATLSARLYNAGRKEFLSVLSIFPAEINFIIFRKHIQFAMRPHTVPCRSKSVVSPCHKTTRPLSSQSPHGDWGDISQHTPCHRRSGVETSWMVTLLPFGVFAASHFCFVFATGKSALGMEKYIPQNMACTCFSLLLFPILCRTACFPVASRILCRNSSRRTDFVAL